MDRNLRGAMSDLSRFVTAVRSDNQHLATLRSYTNPREAEETDSWELWEALRATTAANTYFRAHPQDGAEYLDGALKAPNPVYQVMGEANGLWDHPDAIMISVGTGEKIPKPIKGNLMSLAKVLTKTLLDPEEADRNFQRANRRMVRNGLFYRFTVPALGHVKLEDFSSLGDVKQRTTRFLDSIPMLKYLASCADAFEATTDLNESEEVKIRKLNDLSNEEKSKPSISYKRGFS